MLLGACHSDAEDAERRYEMVARGGTDAERCAAAAEVADAWLHEDDEQQYQRWKLTRDMDCMADRSKRALQQ